MWIEIDEIAFLFVYWMVGWLTSLGISVIHRKLRQTKTTYNRNRNEIKRKFCAKIKWWKKAKTHIALYCVVFLFTVRMNLISHIMLLLLSPSYTRSFYRLLALLFLLNALTHTVDSVSFSSIHTCCVSSFPHTWSLHNFIGCDMWMCVHMCLFFFLFLLMQLNAV